MTTFDIHFFFITLVAEELAPGPIFPMLMVRAAGGDFHGAAPFALNATLGAIVLPTIVCVGLSVWPTSAPKIFDCSKHVMMASILRVARGFWVNRAGLSGQAAKVSGGVVASAFAGLMTSVISPCMMILFPLAVTDRMDISVIEMPSFPIVAAATVLGITVGTGVMTVFVAQLRRLPKSPQHTITVRRTLSGALVVGGGLMTFA